MNWEKERDNNLDMYHCQKNDDEEKLITNMETLVNSNCGGGGNSCYLDRNGSQVHPPLEEDDLEQMRDIAQSLNPYD